MVMKNKLSKIRRSKNYTQSQLAKIVGISRPYLSNIERGRKKPGIDIAIKIAATLNKPVEEIFLPFK